MISVSKTKPFLPNEVLFIDLENYNERMDKAKDEYKLIYKLDGIIRTDNGIKTMDLKRVKQDGEDAKRPGQMLLQGP